jgi:2,4-dienoyl-CoA reductase-like NADH-dependent reductase (Old Yellow Enzyme family)
MTSDRLFSPFEIGPLRLRNRLVRSATAEKLCLPDGRPEDRTFEIYRQLSRGGIGLIISGHAYVDPEGKCHAQMLGAYDDELVPALRRLAEQAHSGGAKVALQINHGGRACDPAVVETPAAPSAVALEERPAPRALSAREIPKLATAFGLAAGRAKTAGFDAVQIHAAHGYLISQFLSPLCNQRADRYGGSLENRARFLQEVAASVRQAVGPEFPVLIKLGISDNCEGGLTIEEGAEVAGWLADWGIDAIETSAGLEGALRTRITTPRREAYLLAAARAVRAQTKLPVILVGGLRSRRVMERLLAKEGIALLSLSRPLIREPDLPRRLRAADDAAAACVSCNRCWPRNPGEGIACKQELRGAAAANR